jgi:GNAT superfamily N-acetyltransferase
MLTIRRANVFHTIKLYNIFNKLKYDKLFSKTLDFYSQYNDNLFLQIILGNVYIIYHINNMKGFIVFNRKYDKLYFIPEGNDISIFKLIHLIKRSIGFAGLNISLNYKNIDINALNKQFEIDVSDNIMFMSMEHNIGNNQFLANEVQLDNKALLTRKLKINKEENLRVELQNGIFCNIKNRMPLTINDILYEEGSSKFLKDFCFVFEEFRVPIGYGQILRFNNNYFLVNFGIIEEYRKKGYGYYFLHDILMNCIKAGINILYLTVDKSNFAAINLYSKMGFKEVHNSITIEFK